MEKEEIKQFYLAARFIEIICIAVAVFGLLWEGTEYLKLTFPEFMMLYGGVGAAISEMISRILLKQIKKKE
ncbi:MAG: hypothetical protein ACFFDN_02685 [Candidatus Hodarchaeota archaeon]